MAKFRCLNCLKEIPSGDFCTTCAKKLKEPSLTARLDAWDKKNLSIYKPVEEK